MNNDIAIKVENISKIYKLYDSPIDRMKEALHWRGKKYHKDFYALNDVSFEIKKGETVGIIGKNGSGKSTLLKIITGVLTPTSGKVTVHGRISALLELGAGFNPEYTGIENVYFQGNLMGYTREQMDARVDEILAFADIGDFIHQPVKMYSSGMFARLAFAVAINVEPDILIVDEALSVGDMVFQAKCSAKMRSMVENGVTILFVSHSLAQVKQICNNAIYLCVGSIVDYGDVLRVCDKYQNDTVSNKLNGELPNFNHSVELCSGGEFFETNNLRANSVNDIAGSCDLIFKGLKLLNSNGVEVDSIVGGDTINVKVSIYANQAVSHGAAVGLLFLDKSGYYLFNCNTNNYSVYLPKLEKGDKIILTWRLDFPFMTGDYRIDVGVKPNEYSDNFFDRVFCAKIFKVDLPKKLFSKYFAGLLFVDAQINMIKINNER